MGSVEDLGIHKDGCVVYNNMLILANTVRGKILEWEKVGEFGE